MDAKYYNGGPECDPWPSVEDHDEDPGCPYCEVRDGEDHQESCHLFTPRTDACAPHGQVKAA